MTEKNDGVISRRQWVGLLSAPVLAAVGSRILGSSALAGLTVEPASGDANLMGAKIYNIRDFGAVGDAKALDTKAVQAAIDACTNDGGGTVLVPAGVFQIGTVEMKSNVTLHITAGGKLLGSADGVNYHAAAGVPLRGDTTLGDGNWGLIIAMYAYNITIEGPGMIDGQGIAFLSPQRGVLPPAKITGNHRPYHILLFRCKNAVIRNLDLFQSAYHSLRIVECSYCRFDGLHIYNRTIHNNDGFHFISCEFCTVSNCNVQSQDDACALFGSCKFITITNSTFSTRWSVFRFGGGEAENITVSNCLLHQVYGCPIKMRCGPGGRLENISFSNIVMQDVTGPIAIHSGRGSRRRTTQPASPENETTTRPSTQPYDETPRSNSPGIVRNISFSNIRAVVTSNPVPLPDVPFVSGYNVGEIKTCIVLNAIGDHVLENISLDNVHVMYGGGGTAEEGALRDVPKVAGEYFEIGRIPAYGLYARQVRGLTLNNVRFEVQTPDLRPAMIFDHVHDAAVYGLSAQGNPGAESTLRFMDSSQTLVTSPRVLTPGGTFLRVEGAGTKGIIVEGGDLSNAKSVLECAGGADETAVKLRV